MVSGEGRICEQMSGKRSALILLLSSFLLLFSLSLMQMILSISSAASPVSSEIGWVSGVGERCLAVLGSDALVGGEAGEGETRGEPLEPNALGVVLVVECRR
jgi:hypothetical protein